MDTTQLLKAWAGGDEQALEELVPRVDRELRRLAGKLLKNERSGETLQATARRARIVELRFFGGLNVRETAQVMGLSEETVMRDWKLARAWLLAELNVDK